MKRIVLMSVLLVSMFACTAVLSQEFEPEDMEIRMEMQEREMELQHREAAMNAEREMQKIEIEQRRLELENLERAHEDVDDNDDDDDCEGGLALLLIICAIVHILVAVWVYTDIRQLNRGSGIWIVIALLAGLLGALVYAVVRLGDSRQK